MTLLYVPLPLGVTLVYRGMFTSHEAALAFSENLPYGFVPVEENDVPNDAVVVPFNGAKMKPEEIAKYNQAAQCPVRVGDTVYIPNQRKRGKVTGVVGSHITVCVDGQELTIERSSAARLPVDS